MDVTIKRVGMALAPVVLVLFVWYLIGLIISAVRDVPFPTPYTTAARLAQLLRGETLLDHSIYRHTLDSLARWGTGFIAAACAGLLFGLAAIPLGAGIWIPEAIDTPEFRAVWSEWPAHVAEQGKTLTARTARMQLQELSRDGPEAAVETLRMSMRNSWTGVFPEKVRNGNGRPRGGNGEDGSYARQIREATSRQRAAG